ncbi:MAG: response regulator [Deltaproteobacteria bacterium]|nr:response regulator [Deltaproteobacteria bacterium]
MSLLGIKRHLEGSEFELVGQAQSGADAIEQYGRLHPRVVLLDIVMPDMDGVAVLEKLRALDGQARVVMVSSLGTKEKVMECMEKGATSFLMKPYDQQALLKVLRDAHALEGGK